MLDIRNDTCYNVLNLKERGTQMKYSELERILKKHGCRLVREGTRHTHWQSPITGNIFPVGRHKSEDVKSGTLDRILKQAGIKLR